MDPPRVFIPNLSLKKTPMGYWIAMMTHKLLKENAYGVMLRRSFRSIALHIDAIFFAP